MTSPPSSDRTTASTRVSAEPPHAGAAPKAHLVVGYDQDPASQAALELAVLLAGRLNAHLDVVHVVDLRDYPIDPDSDDWELQADAAVARTEERARAMLVNHAHGWAYHAWRGDPVHLLSAVADDNDALMIVVGTHEAGLAATLHRMTGGSVSRGLVGHSHRPVLVVPPTKS